jgi:hypothetical protein
MRIENHMSGGAVIDSAGYVVGMVVNGNQNTAGILSIENILATFFSRQSDSEARPALLLNPTNTPLFLKQEIPDKPGGNENAIPALISRAPSHPFSRLQDTQSAERAISAIPTPR